jgi:hypothetical protein
MMVTCLDFFKNGFDFKDFDFDFKAFYVLKKSGVAINYCRVNNSTLFTHYSATAEFSRINDSIVEIPATPRITIMKGHSDQ